MSNDILNSTGSDRFQFIASKIGENILNGTQAKQDTGAGTGAETTVQQPQTPGAADSAEDSAEPAINEDSTDAGANGGDISGGEGDSDIEDGEGGTDVVDASSNSGNPTTHEQKIERKRPFSIYDKNNTKNTLPPDSKIQVMIDGKVAVVPLAEVINSYSGKVVVERQIEEARELNRTANEQLESMSAFQSRLNNTFKDLVTPGKSYETLKQLVADAGFDSIEFEQTLMNDVIPEWVEIAKMSPIERENLALKKKRDYDKSQQKVREARAQEAQGAQFQNEMSKLTKEYSFQDSELTRAGAQIQRMHKDGTLNKAGVPITPGLVTHLILRERSDARADAILRAVNPDLKKIVGEEHYEKEKLRLGRIIFADPSTEDGDLLDSAQYIFSGKIREAQKAEATKIATAKTPAKPSKPATTGTRPPQPATAGQGFQAWLDAVRG